MSEITSQNIGDLFERASVNMFKLLFSKWGYHTECIEIRRQKSGLQHGFDLLLKVYSENYLPIHIFIECKASKSFNTIAKHELTIKSDQLKRSSFPVKDVHIFFSPTRKIDYQNDETSIEDEDNPFCVIDMMGTKDEVCDLFLTYNGNDKDILSYCNDLLKPITPDYSPKRTFEKTVEYLKEHFHSRLKAFLSNQAKKE